MFEASDISLNFGKKQILDNVSVSFEPGKISTILGPNGAGKSTLLKIMSGAIAASSGEVFFNGRNANEYTSRDLARMRAFLAQESSLQFDFSVEEVVILGRIPHLSGWETEQDWAICDWALNEVEMTEFRERKFATLSGGEKQRIHLARVLAQLEGNTDMDVPRWLLLDEPTSALDLKHQHSVLAMVRKLAENYGYGICVVLHDLNLAMRYTDYAVLMHRGKVFCAGETRQTLSEENISTVYGVNAIIHCARGNSCPFIQTESIEKPVALCSAVENK